MTLSALEPLTTAIRKREQLARQEHLDGVHFDSRYGTVAHRLRVNLKSANPVESIVAMFMPSARNWNEMMYEPAGCWPLPINRGDEYAFVIKIPAVAIKAACRGCPLELSVFRAVTPEGVMLAITLRVADDPGAALMLSSVLRHHEEQTALDHIVRDGRTIMIFCDEASRPVARGTCTLSAEECRTAAELLEFPGSRYAGQWIPLIDTILDEIQGHSDPALAVPPVYAPQVTTVPLSLFDIETFRITTVGLNGEAHSFQIDQPDEGYGLEQSSWHLLERLFTGHIVHSPHVGTGDDRRELTDILAFGELGLCLFECKAASVLSTDLLRTTDRRVRNIEKQIDKGISQICGASREIVRGSEITTASGSAFCIPSNVRDVRFGVVMVSELHPSLDWRTVFQRLRQASKDSGTVISILDLRELRTIVGVSKDDANTFLAYLLHRFEVASASQHAHIRFALDGPHLP